MCLSNYSLSYLDEVENNIDEQFSKQLTSNQGSAITEYVYEQQLILNRVSLNMILHPSIFRCSVPNTHKSHSESGG